MGCSIWPSWGSCNWSANCAIVDTLQQYGWNDAQFLPYWENQSIIAGQTAQVKVSAFKSEDGTLLSILNLTNTPQPNVTLTIDADALGLPGGLIAKDLDAGCLMAVNNQSIVLSLGARELKLVHLAHIAASLTAPTNNAVVVGDCVTLTAAVTDPYGTIQGVEFYNGTTRLNGTNWLAGYECRRRLTITNVTAIASSLTNFSLLLRFTVANFSFTNANADGSDVRFTAVDGTTLLSYERERHDPNLQLAEYWVQLPLLSSTAQTSIYVYYRPTPTADGGNPTCVWDTDYLWVHHLGATFGGAASDSTAQGVTGVLNRVFLGRPGCIDGAGEFSRDGSSLILSTFQTPSNATVEAWLRTDALTAQAEGDGDYLLRVNEASRLESRLATGAGLICCTGSTVLATGTWHYVADVYGNQGRRLYLDGVVDGSLSDTGSPTNAVSSARLAGLGFDGVLDEMRMSKIARSADWIRAQHASMGNRLVQYGDEENMAVFTWENVLPGNYALTVVAYDDIGACTTSMVVNIVVNDVPLSTLTAPTNGAICMASASLTLTATVVNTVGTITNVSFYTNGAFWTTGRWASVTGGTNWYTNTWANPSLGTNLIMVKAWDSYGALGVSAVVTNIVNDVPQPTLTAPANNAAYLLPASIVWTATVANAIGGITNVSFFTNGAFCATGRAVNATLFTNVWKPTAGRYALTAKAWDSYGAVGTSALVTNVLVWTNQHIGANSGDTTPTYSAPVHTVNGKGLGIANTADTFRFVYLPMTGNCTIVARVTNFTSTAAGARAGVMMRASTNANAIEVSSLFMRLSNRVYLHQRTTSGGGTTAPSYGAAGTPPYWVKVARTGGNVFTAYKATNTVGGLPGTWGQVGSPVTIGGWTGTNQVLVGLAVNGNATTVVTGKFDNVSITVP